MGELREECRFATRRLVVGDWDGSLRPERAAFVATDDEDSTTLLASDSASGDPVGLLMLFEDAVSGTPHTDLRIGYLIDEPARGQGFATELVAGFVEWCRERSWVGSLSGGVQPENRASATVLTRNGFVQQASTGRGAEEYRLEL